MSSQNHPSLYGRLGCVYSIATVVDDSIDRVMLLLRNLSAAGKVDGGKP